MNRLTNLFTFLGIAILDILYMALIKSTLKEIGIEITKYNIKTQSLIMILIEISFIILLYIFYKKEINHELKHYKNNIKKYFKLGLKCWLIGLLIMFISNYIINTLNGTQATNQQLIEAELKKMPLYLTFSACIQAPICEELIFRKALKKIFKNDILFIITSGLIFGLIHTISGIGTWQMLYMIPYGIFGIMFGYMYTKTNTIFTSITFHMIHNTIFTLLSLKTLGVI